MAFLESNEPQDTLTLKPVRPLTRSSLQEELSSAEQLRVGQLPSVFAGAVSAEQMLLPPQKIAEYNKRVDQHKERIQTYWEERESFQDNVSRCFKVFLALSNTGTAPADEIEVDVELPEGVVAMNQDYRFGHPGTDSIGEPRLRCNVFALLSRSILLSSPVRLQIGSGQGVPATPAATLPTPLRPCLSATPRSGCPALAALPSGHRQRPDPAQHVTEQPPVQMSLGQQQPVVAGMFDQTAAGLH